MREHCSGAAQGPPGAISGREAPPSATEGEITMLGLFAGPHSWNVEIWERSLAGLARRCRGQTGARALKLLKPLFAIYGSAAAGTFGWLFFALSGTAACASGMERCQGVVGLAGQLALVWPAYWGGRISGNAAVTPMVPVAVVVAVLAIVAALALAQALTSREPKEQGMAAERKSLEPARNEPMIKTSALTGNRRNQSRAG